MICNKCNATIADDLAFCPECGQPIEAPTPAEEPVAAPVQAECDEAVAPEQEAPEQEAPAVEEEKKAPKIPKKFIAIGAIAIAAILLIVLAVSMFSGGSVNNYALYIADGELQYADMPSGKPTIELSSNLMDKKIEDNQLVNQAYTLGYLTKISNDGSRIFFPDKINEDGYTLYYRSTSNAKKEPVKIDSDLTSYFYHINEKANLVTYVKDGNLYQHNLKERTKVASDVSEFMASANGKNLIYIVEDEDGGAIYSKKGSKDAVKLASNVTDVEYVSEDMSVIIYSKEDSMYIKKGSKDAVKIDSDISSVLAVSADGEVYYTKVEEEEITYWSLIEDDLDENEETWMREWLQEYTIENPVKSLCYYDGKKTVELTKAMTDYSSSSSDEAVLVYTALNSGALPKLKFSDVVESEDSVYTLLSAVIADEATTYVATGASSVELPLEDIYRCRFSADGKSLFVGANYDSEEDTVTLHKLTLSGGKIKKSQKLHDEVYYTNWAVVNDNSVYYFVDVDTEDNEGELYLDSKKIDDSVYLSSVGYNSEANRIFYLVDYDTKDAIGTLKYFNGKKAVTVKDDVSSSFYFTPAGQVLFMYDYSRTNYKGELWILNGNKAKKLADDVTAIVPVY